ncbi:MAG TPA: LuxR C-terminal-related transcriptional regulator [Moraxellaceae bacterium]|nr:LuxR C-terminal-related transcriptional regulator [Moraxellaceae bacterium]
MASTEKEFELIGDIYDAALEPSRWPFVLQQLATLSECNSAIITALDTLNPAYTFAFTHNIPESALRAYREARLDAFEMEFHGKPMIANGVGSTLLSSEVYGNQATYIRMGGEFYERCLKPSRIHYLAAALLDHDEFRWGGIGIHRPEDWAPLTRDHTALLQRVGQHVRRALEIHRQITAVRQQNAQLYRMLDGMVAGVILVNGKAQVRYANPRAEQLLKRHSALHLNPHDGLRASLPEQQQQLLHLLRGAIQTGQRERTRHAGGVIGLSGSGNESPLMLTITPLSEFSGFHELANDGVAAAIFLTDPSAGHTLSRQVLQQSYGLSPRESDVCQAFVNHATLEGVADECGLSMASVRTYMKEIYAKTARHSQAELMRLLIGLRLDFEHIR